MPDETMAAASMYEAMPDTTPTHHSFGRLVLSPTVAVIRFSLELTHMPCAFT